MKKRLFAFLLVLCVLASVTVMPAYADETEEETTEAVIREPGQCGDAMYWAYEAGVLTITGSGAMDDFPEGAPWQEYSDEITQVILEGGVTYIGANAFTDYDALKTVDFGSALYEIGSRAFKSCDGLTRIDLPASFKIFGEESFMSCASLTEVHCAGRFPSFRQNSMWDTYVTIYFPVENPWNPDNIRDLEEAFHGRIEFLASDGSDPVPPEEEETEPETEPETQPETEPETTEAVTEAVTEGTENVTQNTETEPESEDIPIRPESSEEDEEAEEDEKSGSWIGIVIIAVVAVAVIAGIITFRPRGRYTRRRR